MKAAAALAMALAATGVFAAPSPDNEHLQLRGEPEKVQHDIFAALAEGSHREGDSKDGSDKDKRQYGWGIPWWWYPTQTTIVGDTNCYGYPNFFFPVLTTYHNGTPITIACKTNSGWYRVGNCYIPMWNAPNANAGLFPTCNI